jgi:hypothetical protein
MSKQHRPQTNSTHSKESHPVEPNSEEIHIRNFDVQRANNLTIEVRDTRGLVFANRYHLMPGESVSESDRLPAGTYEIHVQLNGQRRQTVKCDIDNTLEKTALVEVGNGTASVTQGLY